MREKTEESHPQSLRAKEDSTQSTAATHGAMQVSNVLVWGLYGHRVCNEMSTEKIRATVDYEPRPPSQAPQPRIRDKLNSYKLPMPLPPGHLARAQNITSKTQAERTHTWARGITQSSTPVCFSNGITSICSYDFQVLLPVSNTDMHTTLTLGQTEAD